MSHCHPCWCPVSIAVYVIVVSVFSSVVAIVVSVVTIVVNVVTIVVSVVAIVVSVVAIVATVVTIVATVVTIVATVVTIISNVLVSDSLSVLVFDLQCSIIYTRGTHTTLYCALGTCPDEVPVHMYSPFFLFAVSLSTLSWGPSLMTMNYLYFHSVRSLSALRLLYLWIT